MTPYKFQFEYRWGTNTQVLLFASIMVNLSGFLFVVATNALRLSEYDHTLSSIALVVSGLLSISTIILYVYISFDRVPARVVATSNKWWKNYKYNWNEFFATTHLGNVEHLEAVGKWILAQEFEGDVKIVISHTHPSRCGFYFTREADLILTKLVWC